MTLEQDMDKKLGLFTLLTVRSADGKIIEFIANYKVLQFSFHRQIYKLQESSQLCHPCQGTKGQFPFLHFLQSRFHEWYFWWKGTKHIL